MRFAFTREQLILEDDDLTKVKSFLQGASMVQIEASFNLDPTSFNEE